MGTGMKNNRRRDLFFRLKQDREFWRDTAIGLLFLLLMLGWMTRHWGPTQ
jgi:hypothetical protein